MLVYSYWVSNWIHISFCDSNAYLLLNYQSAHLILPAVYEVVCMQLNLQMQGTIGRHFNCFIYVLLDHRCKDTWSWLCVEGDELSLTPWRLFPVCSFFFGGTKGWTQGFPFAKQTPYHLNHTSSPFVGYFGDGVLRTICWGWPQTEILLIAASLLARIICMSRHILLFWLPPSKWHRWVS
jgi:hypothetical protein